MSDDWLNHFDIDEFESPDEPGSGKEMCVHFLLRLDYAREIAKIPFVINSGYRTEEHNEEVGGVEDSSHRKGLAADIAYQGKRERFKIMRALMEAGITRIGMGDTFIHADMDNEKTQELIWTY